MLSVVSVEVVYRMNFVNKLCGMKFNFVFRLVLDFVIKGYEVFFFVC